MTGTSHKHIEQPSLSRTGPGTGPVQAMGSGKGGRHCNTVIPTWFSTTIFTEINNRRQSELIEQCKYLYQYKYLTSVVGWWAGGHIMVTISKYSEQIIV